MTAAIFPIAPLLVRPGVAVMVPVVNVDADARIIIVAVPAEWIVAAVAIIRVVGIAVPTVPAIADANAHPAVRMIAVAVAVQSVGAAAERQPARYGKGCKTESRSVHV